MTFRFVMLSAAKHLLCVTAIPMLASAQSIRGTAVDGTGAPLPGVVVLLVDQRDSVTSRALTNETGEFRVTATIAGVYRLRTMRLGFRPMTSPGITLGVGQEVTKPLVLLGIPFYLDTIRVADRNPCRTPSDSAAAIFAIWEQARTALTATQLTAGRRAIGATIVTYERTLDPDRERVLRHNSSISSGLTRGLWISPPSDSLRRGGYVVSNLDGTTTYWAPDLNVLLSNAFIEDNCFRLAKSKDASQIGIAFEPTRERRGVATIRGTLWLDRKSNELRRMEFRYTNATREQEYGNAGGHMQFARAKNGAWVISAWNIRMPVLEQRQVRVSGINSRATTTEPFVSAIRVEGGELALVTADRDTLWARTPLVLGGTVLDSISGARMAEARVTLRGTSLQGLTDSSGRFRIADVLPGEYTVEVRTRSLAAIGAAHVVPLTFTDSATTLTIRVPTAQQLASATCPGTRDGMVAGMVRVRGDSVPPGNVRVVAEWNETTTTGRRFGGIEARTDARGAFRLCGVPLGTDLTLRTQTDSSSAEPVDVRIPIAERLASAELILDKDVARGAALSGVVLSDINGQPIADVEIAIPELSMNVFTSDRGSFRINDIPAGTRVVVARKMGFKELTTSVAFAGTQTIERSLMLSRVATLDTVKVAESAVLPEFEENRRLGLGRFLTRADLEQLGGQPIASRLQAFPSVEIIRGRSSQGWMLTSRPRLTMGGLWCPEDQSPELEQGLKCGCYPQVYLDKALMNPPTLLVLRGERTRVTPPFDVNSIPSVMIEAVEWYAGPSQTPMKYSTLGSDCGVLVIHTRRGK